MNIQEEKKLIKNQKAVCMDEWELTEDQKDEFDDLVVRAYHVGKNEVINTVPKWTSVKDDLPDRIHECTTSGMEISNTVLVSNFNESPSIGFGHLQENGNWVVYEGEHDFMNPQKVTHWMALPTAPKE